jgi:CheY-like chemotaxis protein
VIVVTADAGSTIDADCKAAGADEVILKPVSMTSLYDTIGNLMARRGGDRAMVA